MFQFAGFPPRAYHGLPRLRRAVAEGSSAGFPHSEICGSLDICSSPQLIAACHVFRRLLVPRHPPCALSCLTWLLARIALRAQALSDVFLASRSFLLLQHGPPPARGLPATPRRLSVLPRLFALLACLFAFLLYLLDAFLVLACSSVFGFQGAIFY